MDATILVNRTHRLPRKAIPQILVEPEIIFDAPVGDRKRLLADRKSTRLNSSHIL